MKYSLRWKVYQILINTQNHIRYRSKLFYGMTRYKIYLWYPCLYDGIHNYIKAYQWLLMVTMTFYGCKDTSYGCQNSLIIPVTPIQMTQSWQLWLSNGSCDFLLVPVTPIPITIECKFWLFNGSYDSLMVDMTLLW